MSPRVRPCSSSRLRQSSEGSVLFDTRAADGRRPEPWTTHWSKPLPPHSIENVGETELHVIMIELKDHPAAGPRLLSQKTPKDEGRCEEAEAPPSGSMAMFSMCRFIA